MFLNRKRVRQLKLDRAKLAEQIKKLDKELKDLLAPRPRGFKALPFNKRFALCMMVPFIMALAWAGHVSAQDEAFRNFNSRMIYKKLPPEDVPEFSIYESWPPPTLDEVETLLPILASRYDPKEGGINCNGDDNCKDVANLMLVKDSMYGKVAACPPGWTTRGTHTTVITITGLGSFWCVDSGGAVKIVYRENVYDSTQSKYVPGMWVIIIDIMQVDQEGQWWEWNTHFDWVIEQRPYTELEKELDDYDLYSN